MTRARTSLVLALAAAIAAPSALALPTCFTVYDRAGDIVYRDHVSPFEGALDPTSSGREAMRRRGEHLVFFEADHCVPVSRVVGLGSPTGRAPTTDEIVSGLPDVGGVPTRVTGSLPASAAPAAGAPPAAAPAGPAGPIGRITNPATKAMQSRPSY